MRNLVVLASVALLALPVPALAQGQGGGNQGQGKAEQGGKDAATPGDRGNGTAGKPAKRDESNAPNRSMQTPGQSRNEGQIAGQRRGGPDVSGQNQAKRADDQRGSNGNVTVRQVVTTAIQADRRRDPRIRIVEAGRYAWRDPGFQGCPPGLAKKGNGCQPPGQARKLSGRDDDLSRWFRYSDWYRADRGDDWRYDGGYAYRVDPGSNLIQSLLPLLGGALLGGNSWPQSYSNYQVTPYQDRYYRAGDSYDYRYADGAVFAVDPETQMIQSVAGLLTGDNWAVGSRMPQGYDFYNVPYDYRDRYADSANSHYRYDDGYVYEVDPTTQLVRRLIELVV